MSKPQMITVESSNIDAIGYDKKSRFLYVQFHSGNSYIYDDVPQEVFDRFLEARSMGGFFAQNIKGRFPATKQ